MKTALKIMSNFCNRLFNRSTKNKNTDFFYLLQESNILILEALLCRKV